MDRIGRVRHFHTTSALTGCVGCFDVLVLPKAAALRSHPRGTRTTATNRKQAKLAVLCAT
jgi:hypothetical protein